MLPEGTCSQGGVVAHRTHPPTRPPAQEPGEHHPHPIKIYPLKETHLVRVLCLAAQTTNLIDHQRAQSIKDAAEESDFLVGEDDPAEGEGNNETAGRESAVREDVSQQEGGTPKNTRKTLQGTQ